MCEGKLDAELRKQSLLMALIANCHRSEKRRAFTPYDFYRRNGERAQTGASLTVEALQTLKAGFAK